MKAHSLWPVLALAACSPEPRPVAYFEAHPKEAERVLSACAAGSRRDAECEHAQAALPALRRAERMARYKKAFE